MSLAHSILNHLLMKNRIFYDPAHPKNYDKTRKGEVQAVSWMRIPKNGMIRQGELGGVPAEWISGTGNPSDRIVFYIHGGGFVTGSSAARRSFTVYIADKMKLNIVSVDYRLAPEHPFPAGCEDCLAAYRSLLEKYKANRIALLGESAGGNLVLSLLLQIREAGLPMPAGTFALSPTVQYDRELPSYRDNLKTDSIVTNLSDEVCDVYLRSREDAVLKDPIAAPYYGDFDGSTPVVLFVSDSEVLLDDSLIMFEKLQEQNVPSKLYVRKGMMHTWIILPFFPESKKDLKILETEIRQAMEGTFTAADEPLKLK